MSTDPGRRASAFARFRALTSQERRLLLHGGCLLPAVAVGLRLTGFAAVRKWALAPPRARRGKRLDPERIASLLAIANGRLPAPASCLVRSLALARLLRLEGWDASLQFGVRREHSALEAHAWVEVGGRPVNDDGKGAYRRLAS